MKNDAIILLMAMDYQRTMAFLNKLHEIACNRYKIGVLTAEEVASQYEAAMICIAKNIDKRLDVMEALVDRLEQTDDKQGDGK